MSDANKRVLVFGVNGFVGPYLASELTDHGYDVLGSDRSSECGSSCVTSFYRGDLLDAESVSSIIESCKPDAIINLAAISSVGQSWAIPQATMQINVVGALNILEAARKMPVVPKVMLIGSSEEYAPSSDPLSEKSALLANNPYGISKMAQERFAETYSSRYGMNVIRVRAFNHTGVGQSSDFVLPSFCKQVATIDASGEPGVIEVGNLEVVRDFSDVRDVVRAYRLLLEKGNPSEAYNVGSGIGHSLDDLLGLIIGFSHQDITVRVDPKKLRPADNPIIVCDNTKIEMALGWRPRYLLGETLRSMFDHYRNLLVPEAER